MWIRRRCASSAHLVGWSCCSIIIVLIIFRAGKLPQLSEGVGKAINGFKKSVHDAEEEAVQHSAEPWTIVSEIIQNNGASLGKQSLPPHVKVIGGGEDGKNLTRQG